MLLTTLAHNQHDVIWRLLVWNWTRSSQKPVIAHLVFNLTSKVDRKWGALLQIKMNSNFNCCYMAMSSLTYILGFSVRFFQPVVSLFHLGILWDKNHIKIFCLEIWVKMPFWMEGGAVGHNIEKGPPNDHPSQICFNLVQRFQPLVF
jgi:hypothetical protein